MFTSIGTIFGLFLFSAVTHAAGSYHSCCQDLEREFSDQVFFPDETEYEASLESYWSLQERAVNPRCIFTPGSSQDLSSAVQLLTGLSSSNKKQTKGQSCKFAVRSGGHTAHAGSANIEDGVTIDMSGFDDIEISEDKESVSVGAGQRWENVYETLQAAGLAVAGGRAAEIGVGGLTLGGGLSYFSTRRGFTCDSVISYEIVLADGSVLEPSQTTNSDLWLALKGGSNNFGIVTRFVFRPFAQGDLWAGRISYPLDTAPQQIEAFHEFSSSSEYDPDASMIQSFGFSQQGAGFSNWLAYAEPVADPPALQPFTSIEPQFANGARIIDLVAESRDASENAPSGLWQKTFATSFRNSIPSLQDTFDLWNSSTSRVADVAGILWSISLQPVTAFMTDVAEEAGGNSLGISVSGRDDTLIVAILSATWTDGADSATVEEAADELLSDIRQATVDEGTFDEYIDLNHASKDQDAIGGYGKEVNKQLRAVSKKYDPNGVFQEDVPGGFKL